MNPFSFPPKTIPLSLGELPPVRRSRWHASFLARPLVLIAQFPPVARSVYQTFSEPDRSGDVLDSLMTSAQSLFTVRRSGSGEGDGPAAALQRMENAVRKGDLKSALAAYKDLPEQGQAAAADWATRAEARVEVDDLTDKEAREMLRKEEL